MKRLTMWYDGNHAICENEDCDRPDCPFADPACERVQDVIDRLAAYEDKGLEPEDFEKAFSENAILKLSGQVLGIEPDRLRELAKADRLIGKTVYYPYAGKFLEKRVSHFIIYDEQRANLPPKDSWFCIDNDMSETFDFLDIGKTVFLTREEAQAALEGMKNG